MRSFVVVATLLLAAAMGCAAMQDMTNTPLGPRPSQCVHKVPSGAYIEEVEGGVLVTAADGYKSFLPTLPECVEDIKNRMAILRQARAERALRNATSGPQPLSPLEWLDYVDYTLQTGEQLERFTADYVVPGAPATDSSQVLFYFIGTENIRSTTDLSILQPVLTWGNGHNGWSYASWNCCPGGQQHESQSIVGFDSGDTLQGEILDDGTNWSVMSEWKGQNATLTVASNGRHFDWLDVTLEVYTITSCSEFAKGTMTVDNMKITQPGGAPLVPQWQDASGVTQCNGKITVDSPSKVTISHNE